MNKKNHHQFYLPWYAGDVESDSWITYLHRNLHHVEGENRPFADSEWHSNDEDAKIHDDILDALYKSEKVDASLIKVIVLNRSALLSGMVNSTSECKEAESVVKSLKDVWTVTNELVIREEDVRYQC